MWKKLCNKNGWIQFFRFVAISRLQTAWWCPSKTGWAFIFWPEPCIAEKEHHRHYQIIVRTLLGNWKMAVWRADHWNSRLQARICLPKLSEIVVSRFSKKSWVWFTGSRNIFKCWIFLRSSGIFGTRSCVCRNGHNRTYFSHTGFTLLPRRVFTVAGIHVCNRFQQLPATCVPMTQFLDFLCCVVLCRAMSVAWHQTCVLLFRAMSVA